MSHLFPRSYDSWRIGDAERERIEGWDDEDMDDPEPLEEAQCDACGQWVDDARLAVANADREKSVTCSNPECIAEYSDE